MAGRREDEGDAALTFFLASAARLSGPILLAAQGELVSERAGVFNVGIEAMMLWGAFGAVAGSTWSGNAVVGMSMGVLAGGLTGLVLGLLVALLRADQIVAGIGMNIFALGFTSFLRTKLLGAQLTPVSSGILDAHPVPLLSRIPLIGPSFFNQSPVIYVGIGVAVVLWLVMKYSAPGLVIRSLGEGAGAADSAGIPVVLVRIAAVTFTGLMAGLGGAYLSIVAAGGVFLDNMTNGRGYLAIAVCIFGRWHPLAVCLAAVLFGAADALQYQNLGVSLPPSILLMTPFVLALLTWILLGRSKAMPADLGRPFIRGHESP